MDYERATSVTVRVATTSMMCSFMNPPTIRCSAVSPLIPPIPAYFLVRTAEHVIHALSVEQLADVEILVHDVGSLSGGGGGAEGEGKLLAVELVDGAGPCLQGGACGILAELLGGQPAEGDAVELRNGHQAAAVAESGGNLGGDLGDGGVVGDEQGAVDHTPGVKVHGRRICEAKPTISN